MIVPVYNVARYLERCLDSIRNQSMGNFEAILVHQGGHDDDLKICKKYVEMDPRFSKLTNEFFLKESRVY
ncbi:MAG: glycosyltransferase family 2 protein [Alphaproteobacteria bacterium]|nr:glycosyltransferase family 2 protein [Alphaproteobacteria bacterium]